MIMKIKHLCFLIFTIFYLQNVFADNVSSKILKELNVTLYTLRTSKDTIAFVKTDTNSILTKPTLVFCQGSMPIPIIVSDKQYGCYFPSINFDYQKLSDSYNLIVISMPHTPVIVESDKLNHQSVYVPNVSNPSVLNNSFLTDNYCDKYVDRANQVIDFVLSQSWANSDSIYLIGHSQGAAVSVGIAMSNSKIKAIAYLSGNPDGRVTEKIKNIRRLVLQAKITPEDAQVELNELYKWWKCICADKQPDGYSGDTPHTWRSFSVPLQEILVNLKIPVFIAYGTEDIGSADGNELMPIYFELNRKTDYCMLPIVGCGHNFEEFTNGKPNYERMHWQEVIDQFIEYIEK